jgi:hypothetical protein
MEYGTLQQQVTALNIFLWTANATDVQRTTHKRCIYFVHFEMLTVNNSYSGHDGGGDGKFKVIYLANETLVFRVSFCIITCMQAFCLCV